MSPALPSTAFLWEAALGHPTVSGRSHCPADLCVLGRLRHSSVALACTGEPGRALGRKLYWPPPSWFTGLRSSGNREASRGFPRVLGRTAQSVFLPLPVFLVEHTGLSPLNLRIPEPACLLLLVWLSLRLRGWVVAAGRPAQGPSPPLSLGGSQVWGCSQRGHEQPRS
uniref:Uncharacterized protein n=1 Tax=Molossus molossus TaxID=27622 RepID=A0A7J8CRW7_MOLMO|nr:hypothetical protein HJG59_009787 [Molossus molossus]